MLYDDFKPIVDLVLNNWTALQLAVEHGMGAPGGEKTAQLMAVYIARYCVENVVDRSDLTEVIEDLMDEEFETVCHDDSPKEIATVLLAYLDLLKEGKQDEVKARLEAMPKCQKWLSQPIQQPGPPQTHGNPDDDTTSSSEEDMNSDTEHENMNSEEPMNSDTPHNSDVLINGDEPSSSHLNHVAEPMDEDADPGWTVVRTRRRK